MENTVFSVDKPLYRQVKDILQKEISGKKYKDKLPTERELAQRFKVSVITVKQAINELVYDGWLYKRPRSGTFIRETSGLKRSVINKNIGFIISREIRGGIGNPYYGEILMQVENELRQYGYSTTFLSIDQGLWLDTTTKNRIDNKEFDGFLITGFINNAFIEYLLEKNSNVVIIDFPVEYKNVGNILVNNEEGAYKMTSYLISLGHKKIAYIGGHLDDICSKERYTGYQKALQENKLEFLTDLVKICGLEQEDGYRIAPQIFSAKVSPTALFCVCDNVALGILRYAHGKKINVPEDISLAGFDNIKASRESAPALTTVAINRQELGRQGVNKLLEFINSGTETLRNRILLDTELIIRDSCTKMKIK